MGETDEKHWTLTLSVEFPEVYLPFLEKIDERADHEVETLTRLLQDRGHDPGSTLLDAPCGIGRHSLRLAGVGYRVTGIDLSVMYVNIATQTSRAEGGAAKFVCGDILNPAPVLGSRPGFEVVINMFISNGYFVKSGDITKFNKFREIAADNAALIVQTVNRDWVVRNFEPEGMNNGGGLRVIQNRAFEVETSTILNDWEFGESSSPDIRHKLSIHMRLSVCSLHEMMELLEHTGWSVVQTYGTSDAQMSDLKPMEFDSTVMCLGARAK